MGIVLSTYFNKAKEKGGLSAQVKLALLTKMSAKAAAEAPDSTEIIKNFEEALAQL